MTLHNGGRIIARTRAMLWARDGGRCWRCNGRIDPALSPMSPDGLTVGHILPLSRGGTDAVGNLAAEHRRCNLAAGDRDTSPRAAIVAPPPGYSWRCAACHEPTPDMGACDACGVFGIMLRWDSPVSLTGDVGRKPRPFPRNGAGPRVLAPGRK